MYQSTTYQDEALRRLSKKQFEYLGVFDHAYIRAVTVSGGGTVYAIHSADGRLLCRTSDRQSALMALFEQDLTPLTVH